MKTIKLGIVISGVMLSLGCGSDTTGPGAKTAAQRYWQLTLNHHAITLATISPYDTIQLIATPRTITGDTLTTTARPIFTTSDTSITIDSTGFVRVHGTATRTNIDVIAKLTVGGADGLTLADTAFVNVVQQTSADLVPMMDSLIFRPVAGDSASRSALTSANISQFGGIVSPTEQVFDTPLVKDSLGNEIPNAAVRFKSADISIASIFGFTKSATVTTVSPGVVLLTAEATVYGRSKTDSIRYVVGWPELQRIRYGYAVRLQTVAGIPVTPATPPNKFLEAVSDVIVLGQGGAILWINTTMGFADDSMDVQFDDTVGVRGPTVPTTINGVSEFPFPPFGFQYPVDPSANIPALGTIQQVSFAGFLLYSTNASNSAIRYFTRSGTYQWRSLRRGLSGTIRVVSNDSIH
jgi:hypothetical protein